MKASEQGKPASGRGLTPSVDALHYLRKYSLSSLVEHELARQISSGELRSGMKLNESDVAERLQVSRGPVREAFRALEQMGLLVNEKNRGVFVRQVSVEEADQIYEVRAALDGLIGRLAAERITAAELAALRAVLKKMKTASQRRDADAYFPLNLEFHEILAAASRNASLVANYRRLVNELNLFRRKTLSENAENIHVSTLDHEAIVDAIANRNAELAQRLLFRHVIDSRDRLHQVLRRPVSDAPKSIKASRTKTAAKNS